MKRILIALSLFYVSTGMINAQDKGTSADTVKLPYKHKVKYADKQLDAGNYFDAQELYKGLNAKKANDLKVLYKLAESYRLSRDYKAAEAGYKIVIDNDEAKYPESWYYYALMLQMNGKYAEAKTAFDKFKSEKAGAGDKVLLKNAQLQSDACTWALAATAATYKVEHLEPPVNHNKTDYAPRVSGNTLYFSSINSDSLLNAGLWVTGQMQSHAYTATLTGTGWSNVTPLPAPLNAAGKHSGNAAITADGKRMYLTICEALAENKISCKIYVSTKDDQGVWSKPKALGKSVNDEGSDNTHPSVAKTENGVDVLYFSSNRVGGKGGYDIYKVDVKHTGTAGAADNLDGAVNTEWDEITPFYYERKNVLFFSSNGRLGFGGYDNYSSALTADGKYSEAENLGSPLNSSADDMGYASGEDKKLFYFVSNRVGIIGDKSETCCDDIFKGENTFKPTLAVSGNVIERVDSTEQNPLAGARVEVYDITDGIPKLVYADSLGKTDFFYPLEVDKKYSLKFSKKDHFTAHHTISTMDLEANDTMNYTATLDKIIVNKTYKLSKIFYEYNSAKLTNESEATLDTLYALLKENPDLTIELSAHTDSIGSASYNMDLSQRRAQSCADYLIAKGLDGTRITPVGYGFAQPVAPNTIGKKDNPEGRALNRRTEFKVLDGTLKQKGDKLILD
jgi:outer membrane protein OmpA-like peptidoglycan-associated protein